MKRFIFVLICCLLLFGSCQRQTQGKIIRYDLPGAILTLDPQFAVDAYSRMIISNIYEGLMTYDENGGLVLGAAESLEVSADRKTLLFKLRQDVLWKDGKPVTADDFVFAFQRMFSSGSPSPFAKDYLAIENADRVMGGTASPNMLGVKARSEYELEITLSHRSPFFPALLAETPAMPCNRKSFDEARGRYGLEKDLVSSNGPFYLNRWDNETTIRLQPNPNYVSEKPVVAGGVYFSVAPEDSPITRLLDGSSDIAAASYDDLEKIRQQDCSATEFQSTVWCIAFNQSSDIWGNPLLRQGLAHTIERDTLQKSLPKKYVSTALLIPPSSMFISEKYRDLAAASPVSFNPAQGRRLFEMGMESLGIDNVTGAKFYVPDSQQHTLAISIAQQSWQKHLSAYMNAAPLPLEEIEQRFLSGDYDIILVPITSKAPSAVDFLSGFKSDSKYNLTGYRNELFDSRLSDISRTETIEEAVAVCAMAESILLHDAVVIPVYFETNVFASAPGLTGVNATAYPSRINFKYVEK